MAGLDRRWPAGYKSHDGRLTAGFLSVDFPITYLLCSDSSDDPDLKETGISPVIYSTVGAEGTGLNLSYAFASIPGDGRWALA
jgi:hypothetical protein